jgi:hypothetical protein
MEEGEGLTSIPQLSLDRLSKAALQMPSSLNSFQLAQNFKECLPSDKYGTIAKTVGKLQNANGGKG